MHLDRPAGPAWANPGGGHRPDAIEKALAALLEAHPTAQVAAIDALASPGLVPVPPSVGVAREQMAEAPTTLEHVVPADRVVAAKLWGQAHRHGTSCAPVRLERQPDRPGFLCFFDVRAVHGVMVVVFVEGSGQAGPVLDTGPLPLRRPRLARACKDAGAAYRWVDPAFSAMLGWAPEEIIGRRTIEFVHPDDHEIGVANWMEMLDTPGRGHRARLRHRHRDGTWVWLEVTNFNRLSEAEHGDVLTEIVDISDEMAAHEALRAREQLLAQLTDSVPVGMFHADTMGHLLFSNRRLHDITGQAVAGTLDEQLGAVVDEDRAALEAALRSPRADVEIALRAADGTVTHCSLKVRALTDEDGNVSGLTGCLEDITAMVRSRRELETKAATDPLTGCLNREATLVGLQQVLDGPSPNAGQDRRGTAVIFVDLDGFKQVNDDLGHAAGDAFLVTVADRMRASIRPGDLLGRVGGDEFVVVCAEVPGPAEAFEIARTLGRRAFHRPGDVAGRTRSGASIGVAWTDAPGAPGAQLIRAADGAMYVSKRGGRGEPAMAAAEVFAR